MGRSPPRSIEGEGQLLRIATFNLETLDDDALAARIAVLRPVLVCMRADVLCLQEVNAQRVAPERERRLAALLALISETPYASYQMVSTLTMEGHPTDRHNLVILSRLPIVRRAQVRHHLVDRPLYRPSTVSPRSDRPEPIEWDRPLLHAELTVSKGVSKRRPTREAAPRIRPYPSPVARYEAPEVQFHRRRLQPHDSRRDVVLSKTVHELPHGPLCSRLWASQKVNMIEQQDVPLEPAASGRAPTRHARATSGHPFVIGIGDDPEQLLDAMASYGRYDPELSKVGTDRIDYRGLLAGDKMARRCSIK